MIRKVWPAILVAILLRDAAARDLWAESRLAGSRVGMYHESAAVDGSQTVTTIGNDFVFNRMGSKVEMQSNSQYTEDANLHLISIHSVMTSSAQATTMDVTVGAKTLAVRTSTGGRTYERTVPYEGEVLGPEAARRLMVSHLKSPGDTVSYQMFYPELSAAATVHAELTDWDQVSVDGTDRRALKVRQTISAMPGTSMLWLDKTGWLLRLTLPSPFGDIETTAVSASAHLAHPATGELPHESFAGTLVRTNVRVPDERRIEQMKIRIRHTQPELGWPDFTADNQAVLQRTRDSVVLEIRRVRPKASAVLLPANDAFLRPNALLQSDDSEVRAIAAKVAGDDRDVYRVAQKLQRWTNENMKFDMGIAIVPASEVVRNRRGTCFGYAVLLASLARAAGIPSRFRMGFAYTKGVWGGHAWVEVLVGTQWVPLDAALYAPGAADAARFSFYTSGLDEGAVSGVGALAKLYGHVEIEVLEYTLHGNRVKVE